MLSKSWWLECGLINCISLNKSQITKLIKLKLKCWMVDQSWNGRWHAYDCSYMDRMFWTQNTGKQRNKPLIWATPYSILLRLTNREKELNPHAMVSYKKTPTQQSALTNYKAIALSEPITKLGISTPCLKCALCGNYDRHKNMEETTYTVVNKNGRSF